MASCASFLHRGVGVCLSVICQQRSRVFTVLTPFLVWVFFFWSLFLPFSAFWPTVTLGARLVQKLSLKLPTPSVLAAHALVPLTPSHRAHTATHVSLGAGCHGRRRPPGLSCSITPRHTLRLSPGHQFLILLSMVWLDLSLTCDLVD